MKVAELLEKRRDNWRELDELCERMSKFRFRRRNGEETVRFAALYRAACADLALADSYQLPPGTVAYLHALVGRCHNQLYRGRRFQFRQWAQDLFGRVPAQLVRDRFFWLAMAIFWGIFIASMLLARHHRQFAVDVLGEQQMTQLQEMYERPPWDDNNHSSSLMSGFYISHNTGIGLQCFALGLLFGVGGLFATVFNAAFLGAAFGFMSTTKEWPHFSEFVTAHGPFELTAIVLSAAAGMRMGFSLINTGGMSRLGALQAAGRQAMPVMGLGMVLFILAAFIEGFVSPSPAPYQLKVSVALVSTALLVFYLFGLGLLQVTRGSE